MSKSASSALRVHSAGFALIAIAAAATLLAVGWWTGTARAQQAGEETVYLCTDNGGALRLVDSPSACKKNERTLALATEAALANRDTRIASLEGRVTDLETANTTLQGKVGSLEALLTGVTRDHDGNRLLFTGMNLQIVNGQGSTRTTNGLGNVIIGYNDQPEPSATRSGSHYLIVGDQHEWTSSGGIVAGIHNTVSGRDASVTGGYKNTARGNVSSVTGGSFNSAGDGLFMSGTHASVTGGRGNTATGWDASVTGGFENLASGDGSSVTGGRRNTARGPQLFSTVSGGENNTASGQAASVSGGENNIAVGRASSILGGTEQTVSTRAACHPNCN
jgi:hypothetical protein